MSDQTEYRIDYTVQRRQPGEDDFIDIGFGSSNGWSTPTEAVHIVSSEVQNWAWETDAGMPEPEDVRAAVEESER